MTSDADRTAALRSTAVHTVATLRLRPVPAVPELLLHQVDDVVTFWEEAQQAMGDAPLPFWAAAWAGGIGLARHVLDHPGEVAGRTVWDVATGSGLVAIAAARAGAATVTASDIDPDALAAVAANAAVNRVTVATSCVDAFAAHWLDHDVVLIGDACYDAQVAARTRAFTRRASAAGAHVLVGDPGRPHLPVADLRPVATYDVPGMGALESSPVVHVGVWTPR